MPLVLHTLRCSTEVAHLKTCTRSVSEHTSIKYLAGPPTPHVLNSESSFDSRNAGRATLVSSSTFKFERGVQCCCLGGAAAGAMQIPSYLPDSTLEHSNTGEILQTDFNLYLRRFTSRKGSTYENTLGNPSEALSDRSILLSVDSLESSADCNLVQYGIANMARHLQMSYLDCHTLTNDMFNRDGWLNSYRAFPLGQRIMWPRRTLPQSPDRDIIVTSTI